MNMRVRRASIAILAVAAFVAMPSVALGFSDPGFTSPFECARCHSSSSVGDQNVDWEGKGPHGLYTTTTRKCGVCHTVHNAPAGGALLLAQSTISGTCLSCHDGTGGTAPYNAITARGGVVAAEHTVEATTTVPGGSETLGSVMGCGSCHSAHRSNVVAPFFRDSGIAFAAQQLIESDCLLRSDVNTTTVDAYPVYGSQWCASCHDQRHSQSGVVNHPVNTSYTFGYGEVTTTAGVSVLRPDGWLPGGYVLGMGQTNAGYVMAPVDASADGRVENRQDPICQQCHEDARNVAAAFDADYTELDPQTVGYNPPYLTFPHQSTNAKFLVETYDDLCLNCHLVSSLP